MKFILSISALCLLLVASQSCTKEVPGIPVTDTLVLNHVDTLYITQPTSITGLWVGTYDVTSGTDAGKKDFYYSFELHNDSTIQVIGLGGDGMTYYGIGTWSLQNGTAFSAHVTTTNLVHTGISQTIIGTYDSTGSKLTGTTTNDYDADYQASFELEKVQ
jgi:hypothetical protein